MPKRRKPQPEPAQPTDADVEAFAAGAEGRAPDPQHDPNAPRTHRAIRVPLNEYEHRRLEALARATGRSKLNAIRWAVLQLADAEEEPE